MPGRLLYMYLGLDGVLLLFSLFLGSAWVLNSQAAFACSLLITYATFFSYKRMVEHRVEAGMIPYEEEYDEDEEDDPYGLWKEEEPVPEPVDMKAMIQEEKARQKGAKKYGKNLKNSLIGMVFPFRLVAYLTLLVAFLALNRHELFAITPFLLGLSVVPVGSVIGPWVQR
jgi:Ca2+/Na+ antiporter